MITISFAGIYAVLNSEVPDNVTKTLAKLTIPLQIEYLATLAVFKSHIYG